MGLPLTEAKGFQIGGPSVPLTGCSVASSMAIVETTVHNKPRYCRFLGGRPNSIHGGTYLFNCLRSYMMKVRLLILRVFYSKFRKSTTNLEELEILQLTVLAIFTLSYLY